MKSFTKFFAFMMAMLLTLGVIAQSDIVEQKRQALMQQAQQEMIDHGPTVDVPPTPEGSTRAVGDDCTDPIVINLGTDLPFSVTGETTCGRGNTYFNTCMGSYDGGEDIHYELVVTSTTLIDVLYDPVDTWSDCNQRCLWRCRYLSILE